MSEKELVDCLETGEHERRQSLTKDETLDELYDCLDRTIDAMRELYMCGVITFPDLIAYIKLFMTTIKTYKTED